MMACSIGVQAANLWALRRNIQWEGSLLLIVGGALGIPVAIYLLQNAETHILRVAFGIIVAIYAGYMLFRPALLAGSVLGIVAFRNINEVGFRRTILVLLLISGASLALA
jgi:uncharacterized membrane protein YfcA